MIRQYHNHKLQINPWYREEEPHNNHETPGRQTKQIYQLSLSLFPIETITKLEWTQSNAHNNRSHNGSNNQIRINNNRTRKQWRKRNKSSDEIRSMRIIEKECFFLLVVTLPTKLSMLTTNDFQNHT